MPEGAYDFAISKDGAIVWNGRAGLYWPLSGNWRILGLLSEITEEQAKGLVINEGEKWPVYPNYTEEGQDRFFTALESLNSLLQSQGIDTGKNILILIEE